MERVNVLILGREYQLACAPGERESVAAAAQHVDRIMQRVRDASKAGTSMERIAILSALQMAAELLATPVSPSSDTGFALGDYKRKIEDMQQVIGAVLPATQP